MTKKPTLRDNQYISLLPEQYLGILMLIFGVDNRLLPLATDGYPRV